MTRFLVSARRVVGVAVCLGALAAFAPRAAADEPVAGFDPEATAALAEKLGLSNQQQRAIRKIHDDARKAEVKLKAEIEVNSIDLRRELEQEDPREKIVATLIEKISRLEGEVRKTRVLAGLAVRKLLSADQRKKMQAFQGRGRRHLQVTLEGDPMELARAEMEVEAERLEDQLRELEKHAQEIDERARKETKAHRRELERAARELRARARELERQHGEVERQHREQERVVRERYREQKRESGEKGPTTLRIESPQPAKVFLDGKRVGTTPYSGEVRPGEHRVKLQWKKSSRERMVHVKASTQIMLTMEPPK